MHTLLLILLWVAVAVVWLQMVVTAYYLVRAVPRLLRAVREPPAERETTEVGGITYDEGHPLWYVFEDDGYGPVN